MAKNVHPFALRIPLDLYELLQSSADLQERSLHREIVYRLRKSFVGEVASAETRERAAVVEDARVLREQRVRKTVTAVPKPSGPPLVTREEPVSLPSTEKADRHAGCRKRMQHHIYHGGKPCPECGYPG